MQTMEEQLLDAWLRLSTSLSKEKIATVLPYNESLICNILYRNQMQNPGQPLTATDLCQETKMLKSQMNRTLNNMEAKHLIFRMRSSQDKRRIFIALNQDQIRTYQKQHLKVLCFINEIIDKVGKEKAQEALEIFNLAADTVEEISK